MNINNPTEDDGHILPESELEAAEVVRGADGNIIEDTDDADVFFEHHRLVIDKGQTPYRIDKYLMDHLYRVTRTRMKEGIEAGNIRVNDQPVSPNYKVRPHDVITVVLNKPISSGVLQAEDMNLDIRYEDDDLMVVYKPPGIAVHPGVGVHSGTLVNGLAFHHDSLPTKPGNLGTRAGLVHRIDKDTSGLLVCAKSEFAMAHLSAQFFNHTTKRTYNAIVWGEPAEKEGTINAPLGRHERHRMLMAVQEEGEGKHAITHYKVLESLGYVSLVECRLETGRTHQIRVHMKHIGHTLFNDERYGGDRILKGTIFSKYKQFVENCFQVLPRQALHAKTLGFVHPRTGEEMFFESELPDDMQKCLERWRTYVEPRRGDNQH